jgi:hypothetical protein
VSSQVSKLVTIVALLILFVLWLMFYYNPEGGFNTVKDVVSGVSDHVKIGAREVHGTKPVIPEDHQKAIDELKKTMERMRDNQNNYCFARYDGVDIKHEEIEGRFPSLGEDGTSLVLSHGTNQDGVTGTSMLVLSGQREVSYKFIPGITPCVIAGTVKDRGRDIVVADKFYKAFIEGFRTWEERKRVMLHDNPIHYTPVESLIITYSTSGSDGNVIRVPDFSANVVNDVRENLQDGGYLYTPDNNHVCFFPTKKIDSEYGCSSTGKDGLDNDCFEYEGPNKYLNVLSSDSRPEIPNQLQLRTLMPCK